MFYFMISSYAYETEVVTFRKEHKLQMYDNKAINEKWQNIMQQGILPYKKKNGIV
jgi:hypothetical protein